MNIQQSSNKKVNSFNKSVEKNLNKSLSIKEAASASDIQFKKLSNVGEEFLNIIADEVVLTTSEAAEIIRRESRVFFVLESDIKDIKKDGKHFLVTLKDGTIYKISGGEGSAGPGIVEAIGHEGSHFFVNISDIPKGLIKSISCEDGKLIICQAGSTEDIGLLRNVDHQVNTNIDITYTYSYGVLEKYDIGDEYTVSCKKECTVDLGYENPNSTYSLDSRTGNRVSILEYVTIENHNTNTVEYYSTPYGKSNSTLIATYNKNTNTTTYNFDYYTEDTRNGRTRITDSHTYNGGPDVNFMAKYCNGQDVK